MPQYVMPLDPQCPQVRRWVGSLREDPYTEMVPRDVLQELMEDYRTSHLQECPRCQEYGAANVEVR